MLGTAWIDRPVDTQGCAPCFHVLLSAAWKRGHAQANDRHSSRVFATRPQRLCPDDPKRLTRSRRRSAVGETRKLAAILVSDVVGYSRLTGADEDRILARLRALRSDLIDPTIAVVACRLAGLSALEAHYAGLNSPRQFGPTQRSRDKPCGKGKRIAGPEGRKARSAGRRRSAETFGSSLIRQKVVFHQIGDAPGP